MLNFTMHVAGINKFYFTTARLNVFTATAVLPPSFYCYRGITAVFLPLPWDYRRNFPIYCGNTAVPRYYRFPHYRVTHYC